MILALTRVIGNHTDLAVGAVLLLVTPVLALASLSVTPQHLPNTVLEMQNNSGQKWIQNIPRVHCIRHQQLPDFLQMQALQSKLQAQEEPQQ